jgi:ABC-type uncharacterized transport system substrate-binding protein
VPLRAGYPHVPHPTRQSNEPARYRRLPAVVRRTVGARARTADRQGLPRRGHWSRGAKRHERSQSLFGELRRLGYVEGKNLVVERYFGGSLAEIYRDVASDVVRRNPDLIYAVGPDVLLALKATTTTIPIVGLTSDPVALGIVPSLSRPRGNITGSSVDVGPHIWGKRLELLTEAVSKLSRLGFITTTTSQGKRGLALLTEASKERGISLVGSPLQSPYQRWPIANRSQP